MHLCYGTVFYTIKSFVAFTPEVRKLILALWASTLNIENITENDENAYKYHTGTDIPNKIKAMAKDMKIKDISTRVKYELVPFLKEQNLIKIIQIINMLIKYDNTIKDDDIFCEYPSFTKKEFISKETWEFEEYISIVLKYVFTNDNELKKIESEEKIKFAKSKINECCPITIIPYKNSIELPIATETSKSRFNNTFKEISHNSSLGLQRDNHLKIFIVDVINNKFEYTNIMELYEIYLADYLLSKNEKLNYKDPEKLQLKFYKALKKIPDRTKFKESILGNLLLYTFLEQVLNAPKLFNSITLSSTNAKSQAVHMLNVDGIRTRLIFGTSEILSDVNTAITNAFYKIKNIEEEITNERNLLMDVKLLNSEFDSDTANLIKSIIIPSKSSSTPVENAFSIFIGYSLSDTDKSLNEEDYLPHLKNKLSLDIENSSILIKNLINNLDLHGYSFYIYFVPFNNAEIDKISITEV